MFKRRKQNVSLRKKMELPDQNWESIKKFCRQNHVKYEDPDFPAKDSSIFYSKPVPGKVQWLRPTEIVDDPQFILEGASRFDIVQGSLGDCWLLAAVASLTTQQKLLAKVVPMDQNFGSSEYFGAFKFNFWHFGSFKEVIIDDRLPMMNGELLFMHSASTKEFWSALLEKAYAKLCGCYQALDGGSAAEALIDFTGGIGEKFELARASSHLFSQLHTFFLRESLMSCAIIGKTLEGRLPNGLVVLHAYSITGIREVTLSKFGRNVQLLRVRNPWGQVEWNGSWSDHSREWKLVSDKEKRELDLNYDNDGEFWISWSDFMTNFSIVEVCNLDADSVTDSVDLNWSLTQIEGSWVKNVSAGGNINSRYFNSNPTFSFEIPSSNNQKTEVLISVSQKDRRRLFAQGMKMLAIAFHLYEKRTNRLQIVGSSGPYTNKRDISQRFELKPGDYAVIVSTYDANVNGDFLVRIFSEAETKRTEEKVDKIEYKKVEDQQELDDIFKNVAGIDMEVSTAELHKILNKDDNLFSRRNTAHLISFYDDDGNGTMELSEFKDLWGRMVQARTIFDEADHDHTSSLSTFELKKAFLRAGYVVSNKTIMALALKFSDSDSNIHFDDFVVCLVKIAKCSEIFKKLSMNSTVARFTLSQFIDNVFRL